MHERKKDQEENCGCKNIHPDRVQVFCPPSPGVLPGKVTRLCKQQLYRTEELSIKVCNVVQKMSHQPDESFFRLDIFLATGMAVPAE